MSYQLQRFKLVDKSKRSETLDTCFEARTKANALNERLIRGTSLPLLYWVNALRTYSVKSISVSRNKNFCSFILGNVKKKKMCLIKIYVPENRFRTETRNRKK